MTFVGFCTWTLQIKSIQTRSRWVSLIALADFQGILLVYDITNKWSFDGIGRWLREVDEVGFVRLNLTLTILTKACTNPRLGLVSMRPACRRFSSEIVFISLSKGKWAKPAPRSTRWGTTWCSWKSVHFVISTSSSPSPSCLAWPSDGTEWKGCGRPTKVCFRSYFSWGSHLG